MSADTGTVALMITALSTFLATISTMLYQGWSSGRQRRWDLADRDAKAKELREATAAHNSMVAEKLDENIRISADGVKMAENAYHEANSVNNKIADTNSRVAQSEKVAGERLDSIDKVGIDTNARVKNIESK